MMKTVFSVDFVKNGVIQLLVTAPWIFFFLYFNEEARQTECSVKMIAKMEFALKYHCLSTVMIIVMTAIKYHAHHYKLDTSKQFAFTKGAKILTVLQSGIAWIALVGLIMGLKFDCSDFVYNAIIFYIAAQVIIILTPFVRFAYALLTSQGKKDSSDKKSDKLFDVKMPAAKASNVPRNKLH